MQYHLLYPYHYLICVTGENPFLVLTSSWQSNNSLLKFLIKFHEKKRFSVNKMGQVEKKLILSQSHFSERPKFISSTKENLRTNSKAESKSIWTSKYYTIIFTLSEELQDLDKTIDKRMYVCIWKLKRTKSSLFFEALNQLCRIEHKYISP